MGARVQFLVQPLTFSFHFFLLQFLTLKNFFWKYWIFKFEMFRVFVTPKASKYLIWWKKKSSDKSYLPWKILHLGICIWGYDSGSRVSDKQISKSRCFLETLDQANFIGMMRIAIFMNSFSAISTWSSFVKI